MTYKIVYYQGDKVDFSTQVKQAQLVLAETELQIIGNESFSIEFVDLQTVELFRLHGLGRMLKITHKGGLLFISVIRFNIIHLPVIGQFVCINFFRTGQLKRILRSKITVTTQA